MQIFRWHRQRTSLLVLTGLAMIAALMPAFFPMPLLGADSFTSYSRSSVIAAMADANGSSRKADFGPNVYIFNPGMPQSEIQAAVDAIANQQVSNQFGTQRYALLFEPGTYGSSATPLNFQVGYYTAVAGLGLSPSDVVINGSIDVYNQCFGSNNCIALVNFWRSLSNLTINCFWQPDLAPPWPSHLAPPP
jgi:hypothetical protein